jgi:transcription-repair coupling factor (superfamily II helicase)
MSRSTQNALPWFRALLDAGGRIDGLPPAAQALALCAFASGRRNPVVCVTDGPVTADTMETDVAAFAGYAGVSVLSFPAWENMPDQTEEGAEDDRIAGNRLGLLRQLPLLAGPAVIVTSVQALLQKAPAPDWLLGHSPLFRVGAEAEPATSAAALQSLGYRFEQDVVEPGQASMRGGILDAWSPADTWPFRVEFVGNTIESIRRFNPADQRSTERVSEVTALPASEWKVLRGDASASADTFLAFVPPGTPVAWSDPESAFSYAEMAGKVARDHKVQTWTLGIDALRQRLRDRGTVTVEFLAVPPDAAPASHDVRPIQPVHMQAASEAFQPDVAEQARRRLLDGLARQAGEGFAVSIYFDTSGARDRFTESYPAPGMELLVGRLSGGFTSERMRLAVASEADLYGRRKTSRRRGPGTASSTAQRDATARVADLSELEPGELVVHVQHGIGRYLGVRQITMDGAAQEVISVEYAEGAKLHIPLTQAHLLSRYVGVAGRSVELHKLGGKRWSAERSAAEQAVRDLAAALLETQAARQVLRGHTFQKDSPWQREFEATFPYEETPDQEQAIAAVKADMESPRPMDRLVCGDAGYGKTEVAMRAAFKAVMGQKQVVVLVPTTVLAQQHFETFSERMAPFPIRVEMLSRFCSPKRRREIAAALADGSADIVIGTHALLHAGVKVRDLGLVIVDEEQRFGVAHKERLKQLRRLVDVLTLTATPIPRTLYLSLTGARDMSLLQTPPRERLAVETIAARNTDEVVRSAILRELNREGQVFYLHNRIMTLDRAYERVVNLVPEARVAVAHGQMPSSELAVIMRDFAAGEYDVLLSTTIIESGLDIPRANTMLIDRADRFGLADLYQLRGRVGRSNHKAYAYLLLPEHGVMDGEARQRIAALRKYAGLGAGFHLALRDLELRGAGNLLGAAQSGHIAAVGFGLYCQLLRRTIDRLQGRTPAALVETELALDFVALSPGGDPAESAAIPYSYIEDEKARLGAYRSVASAAASEEIAELRRQFADRYGPVPPAVERMLALADLRIAASARRVTRIETRGDKAMITRDGELVQKDGRFPRLKSHHTDDRITELLAIVRRVADA